MEITVQTFITICIGIINIIGALVMYAYKKDINDIIRRVEEVENENYGIKNNYISRFEKLTDQMHESKVETIKAIYEVKEDIIKNNQKVRDEQLEQCRIRHKVMEV